MSYESHDESMAGDYKRRFSLGKRVRKVKGSSWHGRVVGVYSTELTPVGYAVESEREPGSVQIYPESALEEMPIVSDAISRLEAVAKEIADGHFTVMRFTTNWRVSFGTPGNRYDISKMFVATTLEEAVEKAIQGNQSLLVTPRSCDE